MCGSILEARHEATRVVVVAAPKQIVMIELMVELV